MTPSRVITSVRRTARAAAGILVDNFCPFWGLGCPKRGLKNGDTIENKNNTAYELVPTNKIAFHAGVSAWMSDESLNKCSIGIECHCPNYANALNENLDLYHFEPFTEYQINTCIKLIKKLQVEFSIPSENILGHSDIASFRKDEKENIIVGKTDPGATFPWEKLAKEHNIGLWFDEIDLEKNNAVKEDSVSIIKCQELLSQFGYRISVDGILSLETKYLIKAFQLHYMQDSVTGNITPKMLDLLVKLNEKTEYS
ncbi:MAG: hypothetical protein LEGION0398_MBIBDBAK_00872 [Legionellaceae bacterium]